MNWLQRAGAALALAATLGLGLGAMSASAQTRTTAPTSVQSLTVQTPTGQTVQVSDVGGAIGGIVPRMICVPNMGCGDYEYFDYTGTIYVTYAGRRHKFEDRPWWQRGIEGCSEGDATYGFWALLTSWDPPAVFMGLGIACVGTGIGRIIIP